MRTFARPTSARPSTRRPTRPAPRPRRCEVRALGICAVVVALAPAMLATAPGAAGAARGEPPARVRFAFDALGDPAAQSFRTVGAAGQIRYGNGELAGSATIAGIPYEAELLVTLGYVDGSGPFTGWWTFTNPAGDHLAFSYRGRTSRRPAATRIAGRVRTIGGTGTLVDVTGGGTVRGVRRTEVGGDVRYRFDLRLRGLPAR